WTTVVVNHRWAATFVALASLGVLLIPAFHIEIGAPRPDALDGPPGARAALSSLESSGIDAGVLDPFEIVVDGAPAPVVDDVSSVNGVRGVVAPEGDHWRSDTGALLVALPQSDGSGSASRNLMNRIRGVTHNMEQHILVGGVSAI